MAMALRTRAVVYRMRGCVGPPDLLSGGTVCLLSVLPELLVERHVSEVCC